MSEMPRKGSLQATPSALASTNMFSDGDTSSAALADVAAERRRQITAEGWTPEHDDEHGRGELAKAAACYAVSDRSIGWQPATSGSARWRPLWPWEPKWWKPKDRRRDLIRAAALIVAEIERLDRAARATPEAR